MTIDWNATRCRHWHPRYGFCELAAHPSDNTTEAAWAAMGRFKAEHGYYPPIVLRGRDMMAMGPVYEDREADND